MIWVVQDIYEQRTQQLLQILNRYNIENYFVKIVPFVKKIQPDLNFDKDKLVFTCGSYTMNVVSKRKGWIPGAFTQNINMQNVNKHYKSHSLNYNSIICKLGQLKKHISYINQNIFIRPTNDNKAFSGEVFTHKEALHLIERTRFNDGYALKSTEQILVNTNPVNIYAQYRFFIIDNKIITYSRYKLNNRYSPDQMVDQRFIDFVQKMIDIWVPNRAFVMDVADTADGIKVIELNTLNSAGFYKIDLNKLILTIENMEYLK